MKRSSLVLFILFISIQVNAQIKLTWPSPQTGLSTSTDFVMGYSNGGYVIDKSQTIYAVEGDVIVFDKVSSIGSLRLEQGLVSGTITSNPDSSKLTLNLGNGPSIENVIIQEVYKNGTESTGMVKLSLTVHVSEALTGATVGATSNNTFGFQIGGFTRELKTEDGSSEITYEGRNRIEGVITDGCYSEFVLDQTAAPESDVRYSYLNNTRSSSNYVKYGNGNWLYIKHYNENPLAETYRGINQFTNQFTPNETVYLNWRASDCLDSIYVLNELNEIVFADSVEFNQVEKDTLENLPIGIYRVYGNHLVDNEILLYEFLIEEELFTTSPMCPDKATLTQSCSSTEEGVSEIALSIPDESTIDNPWTVSTLGSGPFAVDIEMVPNATEGTIEIAPKFKVLKGVDAAWDFKVVVRDTSGMTCEVNAKFEEESASVSGFVNVDKMCAGGGGQAFLQVTNSSFIIVEGTSCQEESFDVQVLWNNSTTDINGIEGAVLSGIDGQMIFPGEPVSVFAIGDLGTNASVNVNLNEFSFPPSINVQDDIINEGETYQFNGSVYGGYQIDFNWNGGNDYRFDEYELQFTPVIITDLEVGDNNVYVSAWDCFFMFNDSRSFNVEVINIDPVINSVSPSGGIFSLNDPITIQVDAFDFGPITVTAQVGGNTVQLTKLGSVYEGTLLADGAGDMTVSISVNDEHGGSAFESFPITVSSTNFPPSLIINSPGGVFEVVEQGFIDVSFDADDSDGSIVSAFVNFEGASFPVSFPYSLTLVPTIVGPATIEVVVTDDGGLSTTETIGITVVAENRAPQVSINSPLDFDEVELEASFGVSVNAIDSDGFINIVSVSYEGVSYDLTSAPYDLSLIATQLGIQVIEVTAVDDDGVSVTESISINVVEGNVSPTVVFLSPANLEQVQEQTTFNVSVNPQDSDGTISSAIIDFDGGSYPLVAPYSFDVIATQLGTQEISVTVTDNDGASTTESITVVVVGLTSTPQVIINSPTSLVGYEVGDVIVIDFDVISTLPLNQVSVLVNNVTYNVVQSGDNYSLSIPIDELKDYSIELIIEDGNGDEFNESIVIAVENSLPKVEFVSPLSGTVIEKGESFQVDVLASDVDDNIASVIIEFEGVFYDVTTTGTIDLVGEIVGQSVITVVVMDAEGASTTSVLDVIIEEPNLGPVVTINAPTILSGYNIGDVVTIDFDAVDRDDVSNVTVLVDGSPVQIINDGNSYSGEVPVTSLNGSNIEIIVENSNGQIVREIITIDTEKRGPTIDIISPLENVEYTNSDDIYFQFDVSDPDAIGIDSVEILIYDVNNPFSEVYKYTMTEEPYEISYDDLPYFPWENDTLGVQVVVTAGGLTSSDFIEIFVNVAIGLDADKLVTLDVYPVPVTAMTVINCSSNSGIYIIRDLRGEVILTEAFSGGGAVVNLGDLVQGMYLLEVVTDSGSQIRKIEKL